MNLSECIDLLRDAVETHDSTAKVWTDLGCGNGLFTYALSHLLPPNSTVIAVDKAAQQLKPQVNDVRIEFRQFDFSSDFESMPQVDGVLIANALHYVREKKALLGRIHNCLRGHGRIVIIEYDTDHANRWIPHPIRFVDLQQIITDVGFLDLRKTAERPSSYGDFNMYVAAAHR
jgi:SAM-dependent methyltransferase